jgi:probable HAF family extracellular repeat protein
MQGLGDLAGGGFYSDVYALNGDGSVIVGSSEIGTNRTGAYRWTSASGMVNIGDLPGGTIDSESRGVSADGTVIVGIGHSASGPEAFRWTSGGQMQGLGDLDGGIFASGANGMSADGSIVVGNADTASGGTGFVWTSADGMRSLWDVLLAGGCDPAADGWTRLFNVPAVSGDGLTVVGIGTHNGNSEAFAATIPEPAGATLLLVFVSAGLRRRQQRS